MPSNLVLQCNPEKLEENMPLTEYESGIVVFDEVLGAKLSKGTPEVDLFFTRGRYKNLDVHSLSQSYFDLPKRNRRNNSNFFILLWQTLNDVKKSCSGFSVFDLSYDDFNNYCHKAWDEDFKQLFMDRPDKRGGEKL